MVLFLKKTKNYLNIEIKTLLECKRGGSNTTMPLITIQSLTKAIEQRLTINSEEAQRYAGIVMDLFGFDDCVLDNLLENTDRKLFYLLEELGLVKSQREEFVLHDGRVWRIHLWVLQRLAIAGDAKPILNTAVLSHRARTSIYTALPDRLWTMRKQSTT